MTCVEPTQNSRKLTEARKRLRGLMTKHQRVQMAPVAMRAAFWLRESDEAGRAKSAAPASTRPHCTESLVRWMRRHQICLTFMMGAQKWTVLGPMGEFQNLLNVLSCLMDAASAAVVCHRRCAKRRLLWMLVRRAGWRKARRPKRAADMVIVGALAVR